MNYLENNLKIFNCSNKKGYTSICKCCEKKIDINEYLEQKKDSLYINQLNYNSNKNGIYLNNEILNLSKLNAKLKRKLWSKN